jgi:hypothetical protein
VQNVVLAAIVIEGLKKPAEIYEKSKFTTLQPNHAHCDA